MLLITDMYDWHDVDTLSLSARGLLLIARANASKLLMLQNKRKETQHDAVQACGHSRCSKAPGFPGDHSV